LYPSKPLEPEGLAVLLLLVVPLLLLMRKPLPSLVAKSLAAELLLLPAAGALLLLPAAASAAAVGVLLPLPMAPAALDAVAGCRKITIAVQSSIISSSCSCQHLLTFTAAAAAT
jgi:hypothetical protein